jgi:hypothetical protein
MLTPSSAIVRLLRLKSRKKASAGSEDYIGVPDTNKQAPAASIARPGDRSSGPGLGCGALSRLYRRGHRVDDRVGRSDGSPRTFSRLAGRSNQQVDPVRWIMVIALTLFLAEGFTLSVFPTQFKEFLQQMEPRLLQAAGLAETIIAAGLMAGILLNH